MSRRARLRNVLAQRRVVLAAAVAALALVAGGGSAAGAGGVAWTKAWAEQEVREHFSAVSAVCLPLGRGTRVHGSETFREFVCAFVTADGSRFTIRVRPRTQTTWTVVSIKRLSKPTTQPGGGASASNGHGGGEHGEKSRHA